jgi:Flp pilus assembly protein TadG
MGATLRYRAFFRDVAGSAALEFALATPLLVLLLVAAVEIGTGAYEGMRVQNAAEAGAIYASKHGLDVTGISNAVVNATSGRTSVTATPMPAQFCGCPSASGIATTQCTTTCSDGRAPGYYVRISAQLVRDPPLLSIAGLTVPPILTGEAVVRLY